jgi:hypothetical protein
MLRRVLRLVRQEPPGPDLLWLNRHIAIYASAPAGDWTMAYEAGVRGVIVLQDTSEDKGADVRSLGMRYLGLHLERRGVPNPEEMHLLTTWAVERNDEDCAVLIQDSQHRNNDGLVAAATLVKSGLPAHLALRALQRVRPEIRLDYAQSSALVRFAASQSDEA